MKVAIRTRFAPPLVGLALVVACRADRSSVTDARPGAPAAAAAAVTSTVDLPPTADTYLNLDALSHSTETTLNTYTWPDGKIANAILMRFDLSSIPASSTITSATLNLYLNQSDATPDPTYTVTVHQVINKNPNLASATGYTYDGANAWTANNCCSNGIPLAQADISSAVDTEAVDKTVGFKQWDVTSIVQAWFSNPSTNFSLLVNSDPSKLADHWRFFSSGENAVTSQRPFLTVAYTTGSGSGTWPNDPYSLGLPGWSVLTDQPWDNFVMPPIDIGQGPGAWSYYSNLAERGATAGLFNEGTGPLSPPGTLRFTYPAGMPNNGAETERLWYDFPTPASQFYGGFWWKRASNWEGTGSKLFYVRWGSDPANPTSSFWFAADPGGFIPNCSGSSWFFFDNTGTGGPQGNGCYPPNISTPAPTWGVWHQIEFLFTMTTVKWWVDGNLLGSYSISTPTGGWLDFSHEPIWGDFVNRTITSYDYIDHTHITAHP